MRCINRILFVFSLVFSIAILSSCGKAEGCGTYDVYDSSGKYNLTNNVAQSSSSAEFFAKNLCVAAMEDVGTSAVHSDICSAAGAFNCTTNEVIYAQHMYESMYPASTSKIVTCLVALENGNLDDYYTISANAVNQSSDSSVIKLKEGDVITLRDLLYGMMLRSGNDAAVAIAEGVSGDVDSFMVLVNDRLREIGATKTNFCNPNGLHDENHYTTVYDMYLVLNEALKNPDFCTFFTAREYTANYTSGGQSKSVEWVSTNQYLKGDKVPPSGITVIGGKTGTTGAAGYCLVCLSENEKHEKIVSIIFNADGRSNLYYLMNEILEEYAN